MFKIMGHISSFQTLFGSVLRKFALKDLVQQSLCQISYWTFLSWKCRLFRRHEFMCTVYLD